MEFYFLKMFFKKKIVLPISWIRLEKYKYFSSWNQKENSNFWIRGQDIT